MGRFSRLWRWGLLVPPFALLCWCAVLVVSSERLQHRVRGLVTAIWDLNQLEEDLLALERGEAGEGVRLEEQYRGFVGNLVLEPGARGEIEAKLAPVGELASRLAAANGAAAAPEPRAAEYASAAAQVRQAVSVCRRLLGEISSALAARWKALSWLALLACVLALAAAAFSILSYERELKRAHAAEAALLSAQKLEAVGRLAGGVAHDFNNLMSVVLGHAELLKEELGAGNPVRQHVEEIEDAAWQAADLTRQLLAFGRRQSLRERVLDVNLVASNLSLIVDRVVGAGVTVELALEEGPLWVRADRRQLERVMMDLALNARQSMAGGGRLTIRTESASLGAEGVAAELELEEGSYVRLTVADDGAGMDQETVAQLFEPFFTTREEGPISGLGLATVYGIVKQSGGGIHVESRIGQGTSYDIYLPRAEGPEDTEPAAAGR